MGKVRDYRDGFREWLQKDPQPKAKAPMMTQDKPTTFDGLTQEAIDFMVDQGHLSPDAPVWGQFEGLTRTYLEGLKRRGLLSASTVDAVLKGEA